MWAMPTRRILPHEPPRSVDPAREIWFITVCCQRRDAAQLTLPAISQALLESVGWRVQQHHWYARLFLFMPDHCHALLSFPAERVWTRTIRDWKHWTSVRLGIHWQREFFDHRLRSDESFGEKAEYIAQNPVRAGLVTRAEDWPHVWRSQDAPFTGLSR